MPRVQALILNDPCVRKRLARLNVWDTLCEKFCLSDQSTLIDAFL